jgi:hypothetical protein
LKEESCKFFEATDGAAAPADQPTPIEAEGQTLSADTRSSAETVTDPEAWSLPLGAAYHLKPQSIPDGALGPGSFHIDYMVDDLEVLPAITGEGLAQTYLIFGGPGAGKTYYFKYLLSSLLAHPRRL